MAERIAAMPTEIAELEEHARELKDSSEKFQKLLDEINALDDSDWNRHSFTSELATGMRKLENSRIEFMMMSSKTSSKMSGLPVIESSSSSNSFIHELNSLSFKQCFRIGYAFFMPLILGVLLAVLIWGLIFFLTVK